MGTAFVIIAMFEEEKTFFGKLWWARLFGPQGYLDSSVWLFQPESLNFHTVCCWSMLIDSDWCWSVFFDAHWCWLVLIVSDWCRLILIAAYIVADCCWFLFYNCQLSGRSKALGVMSKCSNAVQIYFRRFVLEVCFKFTRTSSLDNCQNTSHENIINMNLKNMYVCNSAHHKLKN